MTAATDSTSMTVFGFATRSGTRQAATLQTALEILPFAYFSLSGDISRAHRLCRVREEDWPRQACRGSDTQKVYLQLRRDVRDCLCFLLVVQVDVWVGKAGLLLPSSGTRRFC